MLSDELLRAYRETDYWCVGLDGEGPVSLRIGQVQPALSVIYTVFRVESAAFITACNPLSRRISDAENILRQERLQADLKLRGYTCLMAEGRPLRPGWEPEASWLVPGMPLAEACEFGRRYQQNAIVWVGLDLTPQLQVLVTGYNPESGTP